MTLVGSTNSLDSLELLIKRKWSWNYVVFIPVSEKLWNIASGNGLVSGLIVRKVGNIFRLEMEDV